MRIPRMTTRRWMIAVAVIAVALAGAEVLRGRRAFALAMASRHYEIFYALFQSPEWGKDHSPIVGLSNHHLWMAEKWTKGARYPRLPVEPDPPEPTARPTDRPTADRNATTLIPQPVAGRDR